MTLWQRQHARMAPETAGFLLGFLGVAGFSATLPATRVAVAYLDPTLVGLGRSILAGGVAALLLWLTRQPLPSRRQFKSLAVIACGVIVGFPLLTAWAMQELPAAHGAIVVAIIPLFTALVGAWRMGQRPSVGFWLCSVAGSTLVLIFASVTGADGFETGDGLLILASLAAAIGYAEGGRLAKTLGGWQVICWALVLAAPFLLLPVAFAVYRHGLVAPVEAWLGFAYVSLISQLFAFVLWYQGLALGGVVRVSQVQLLQPFLTLIVAAVFLGEHLTPITLGFAAAVAVSVALGRRRQIPLAQNSSGIVQ